MKTKKLKFVAGAAIIIAAVVLLAVSGMEESKAYYQTVQELKAMGPRSEGVRVRVAGIVVPGSIARRDSGVSFQISQGSEALSVHYVGRDPLPDTLVDEAEAVVEGYLQGNGNFEAHSVQAKCASKYEAEYGSEY
jgi:cytochrome c-type biogenesis protein CcmE